VRLARRILMPVMANKPKDELANELEALGREFGPDRSEKAWRAFLEVARWLRCSGHGDVTLSAHDHKLGAKVRFVTHVDIDRPGP
jgi:hypothetical protein